MAEIVGVLLGDGCRSRFQTSKGIVELVAFTGNVKELEYYKTFIQRTIMNEFGVSGYLSLRLDDHVVRYVVQSKKLNAFLDSLSIPVGKRLDAKIPELILNSHTLQVPFVRGFYHAEGSVYRRYSRRYNRHQRIYSNLLSIQFRTKLRTMMTQMHALINSLGIETTRLVESSGVYTFRITRQLCIQDFFRLIQPRYKIEPRTV